jgi:hypothetical protein
MDRCEPGTTGRPGSGRRRGVGPCALAIALSSVVLALQSPFVTPHEVLAARSVASPSLAAQSCAWPWVVGVQNYNVAFPDSAEFYYSQPLVAGASARVTITGTYPDARYFALQVYTPYGNPFSADGVGPSLPDYRIAPEKGSINPWQHRAAPGGRYAVTIAAQPEPGESNVLPMPPGTSVQHPGYLLYRVYLPAGGTASHLTLPTITLTQGATSRALPTCRTHSQIPPPEKAPAGTVPTAAATAPPPPGAFYKPNFQGGAPNADTAFVWAYSERTIAALIAWHRP